MCCKLRPVCPWLKLVRESNQVGSNLREGSSNQQWVHRHIKIGAHGLYRHHAQSASLFISHTIVDMLQLHGRIVMVLAPLLHLRECRCSWSFFYAWHLCLPLPTVGMQVGNSWTLTLMMLTWTSDEQVVPSHMCALSFGQQGCTHMYRIGY